MALFGKSNGAPPFYSTGTMRESVNSNTPSAAGYVGEEEKHLMNMIIEKKFSNNAILCKSDADHHVPYTSDVMRKFDEMDIGHLPDQNEEIVDEYYYEYETTVTRPRAVHAAPASQHQPQPPQMTMMGSYEIVYEQPTTPQIYDPPGLQVYKLPAASRAYEQHQQSASHAYQLPETQVYETRAPPSRFYEQHPVSQVYEAPAVYELSEPPQVYEQSAPAVYEIPEQRAPPQMYEPYTIQACEPQPQEPPSPPPPQPVEKVKYEPIEEVVVSEDFQLAAPENDESAEPVVVKEAPLATEEDLEISEKIPVAIEETPGAQEVASTVSEEVPVTSEEVPALSEEVPVVSEKVPVVKDESRVVTSDQNTSPVEILEDPEAPEVPEEKEETLAVKPTPPDPEHVEKFLKDILRKNFKARNFMLGIEHSLTELMSSETATSHEFSKMNTYFRMIVHHMCDLFGLEHNYEQSKQVIVAAKKPTAAIPSFSIQAFLTSPEMESLASASRQAKATLKSVDKTIQTSLTNIVTSTSTTAASSSSGGADSVSAQTSTSTVTSPTPTNQGAATSTSTGRIKRDPNNTTASTPTNKSMPKRKSSSREPPKVEKTAEYNHNHNHNQRAKSRLFQNDSSSSGEMTTTKNETSDASPQQAVKTRSHEEATAVAKASYPRKHDATAVKENFKRFVQNVNAAQQHYQIPSNRPPYFQEKRPSDSDPGATIHTPADQHTMLQPNVNVAPFYYATHPMLNYHSYQYQQFGITGPPKPMQHIANTQQALGPYANQYGNQIYATSNINQSTSLGSVPLKSVNPAPFFVSPPPPPTTSMMDANSHPHPHPSLPQQPAPSLASSVAPSSSSPTNYLTESESSATGKADSGPRPSAPQHHFYANHATISPMNYASAQINRMTTAYPSVGGYLTANSSTGLNPYAGVFGHQMAQMAPLTSVAPPPQFYSQPPPNMGRAHTSMAIHSTSPSNTVTSPVNDSESFVISNGGGKNQQRSRYNRPQSQATSAAYYRDTSLNPLASGPQRIAKKPTNERSASSSKNLNQGGITRTQFKNMNQLERTAYQLNPTHYQFNHSSHVINAQMKSTTELSRNMSYHQSPSHQSSSFYSPASTMYPQQMNRSMGQYSMPPPPSTSTGYHHHPHHPGSLVTNFMGLSLNPYASNFQVPPPQSQPPAGHSQAPAQQSTVIQSTPKPFHQTYKTVRQRNSSKPTAATTAITATTYYNANANKTGRYESKQSHRSQNSMSESSSGEKPDTTDEPTTSDEMTSEPTTAVTVVSNEPRTPTTATAIIPDAENGVVTDTTTSV